MKRYDSVTLSMAKFDEYGFLHDTPIVTRSGVFTYLNADGTIRREYRPPDEVFNADSIKTLKGVPITLEHPLTAVNAGNVDKLSVGAVLSEGLREDNNMRAEIVIHKADVLNKGYRELSLGYNVDLEQVAGTTPEGESYDYIQRNIRYNHLAIVKNARAGRKARLNLDGDEIQEEIKEDKKPMAKLKLDNGLEYEAADEVIVEFSKLKENHAQTKGEVDKKQAKIDSLEIDLQKAIDEKAQLKKDHEDSFTKAVQERAELAKKASEFNVDGAEILDNRGIMEAVIKAVRGDMDLKERSDEYVQALYDISKEQTKESGIKKQASKMNSDACGTKPEKKVDARQAMLERMRKGENK